jgi:uncharacterized surface protein with fasciclin (FAS1) repeats
MRYLSFPLRSVAFLCGTLMLVFSSCQKENLGTTVADKDLRIAAEDRSSQTIVDIAVANPNFSTLVAAVVKTGLTEALASPTLQGTVLAPNNAAFAKLAAPFNNAANITAITDQATIATLRGILLYHVFVGKAWLGSVKGNGFYTTLRPRSKGLDNRVFVSRSPIEEVFINGKAKVLAADVRASNGIIHIIDNVLIPPTQNIAEIAIANGSFTALVAALVKTNLVGVFNSDAIANYTVFAPTDEAFAKLPAPLNNAANIGAITDAVTINTLRSVLLYHVLGGSSRTFSAGIRDEQRFTTLLGHTNTLIAFRLAGVEVQGKSNATFSSVVIADILATNGVIHAIDQVLLP